MTPEQKEWYDLGYEEQCWRYPLLDHVWGDKKYFWQKAKYPKKFQKYYRQGQIQAYLDGKAEKPWFYDGELNDKTHVNKN
jgi:hypothetical protein